MPFGEKESRTNLECQPIRDWGELWQWSPPDAPRPIPCAERSDAISGQKWHRTRHLQSLADAKAGPRPPRTLLCHDMMGGYREDRFFNGCPRLDRPAYTFTHWAGVDTFVYFSHHFITIPPPGWISAAHKNGVQVLGTIITEWDEGSELCAKFLQTDDSMARFVDKCVEIARECGFDGWLLNIENPLPPDQLPRMLDLVRQLTSKMHSSDKSSLVLWYDSVTADTGELMWQNELNDRNRAFFDVCDGIFLNYTWTEASLNATLDTLSADTDSTGRALDVYVGVDVFGRGCFGGGQFNCRAALTAIRRSGLSAAVFAPGWTYEIAYRREDFAEDGRGERLFAAREHAFWKLLEPYLYFRGPKLTVGGGGKNGSQSRREEPVCVFETRFNKGCGKKDAHWWLDLARQEFQCSFFYDYETWPAEAEEDVCVASQSATDADGQEVKVEDGSGPAGVIDAEALDGKELKAEADQTPKTPPKSMAKRQPDPVRVFAKCGSSDGIIVQVADGTDSPADSVVSLPGGDQSETLVYVHVPILICQVVLDNTVEKGKKTGLTFVVEYEDQTGDDEANCPSMDVLWLQVSRHGPADPVEEVLQLLPLRENESTSDNLMPKEASQPEYRRRLFVFSPEELERKVEVNAVALDIGFPKGKREVVWKSLAIFANRNH